MEEAIVLLNHGTPNTSSWHTPSSNAPLSSDTTAWGLRKSSLMRRQVRFYIIRKLGRKPKGHIYDVL